MAELRICFLGDSYVNGTGDPDYLGWVGRICRAARARGHDVTPYNLGIRRETSRELRARWQREVAVRLPADTTGRLVFSFGVNDTTAEGPTTRVPLAESLDNAHAILAAARREHPTILVGPPPVADPEQNTRIAHLSGQLAQVATALAVPYLETYTPLLRSAVWLAEAAAGDGAHPGASGYAELASLVDAWPAWRAWTA